MRSNVIFPRQSNTHHLSLTCALRLISPPHSGGTMAVTPLRGGAVTTPKLNAPTSPAPAPAAATIDRTRDTGHFPGGVTPAGLTPAVSPALQKATFERVFSLGKMLAGQGKVPVIVIDHRLTGLDDRPILKK